MIYAVRTTAGREENVARRVATVIRRDNIPIKAILVPKEIKSYIFIETDDLSSIEKAKFGVQNVRGIVKDPIEIDHVKKYLESKVAVIKIKKGDLVELTGGPFKGEKAKIVRVNKERREATIELIEAAVPIPVTTGIETMRLIQEA